MMTKRTGLPVCRVGWLAALMLCLAQPAAAATSYLHELEVEAARTGGDEETSPPAETNLPEAQAPAAEGESIDVGLSKADFEAVLEKSYYGSYLFYSTLSAKGQEKVYESYLRDNRIDSIRETINEQLKN